MSDEIVVITGKEKIEIVSFLALRGALKLEIKGLKRRGQSARAITCQRIGLPPRTTAKNALVALDAHIAKLDAAIPR